MPFFRSPFTINNSDTASASYLTAMVQVSGYCSSASVLLGNAASSTSASIQEITLTSNFNLSTSGVLDLGSTVTLGTINASGPITLTGVETSTVISLANNTASTGATWLVLSGNNGNLAISQSGAINAVIFTKATGFATFAGGGNFAGNVGITGTLAASGVVTFSNDTIFTKQTAICSANVVKTADIVLADLTGMSLTVTTGGTYSFEAEIMMSATTTGGWQTVLAGTATFTSIRIQNTMNYGPAGGTAATSTTAIAALNAGNNVASTGTASTGESRMSGSFVVNAGGTIKIQVAQNNNAGASTFYAMSKMTATRVL